MNRGALAPPRLAGCQRDEARNELNESIGSGQVALVAGKTFHHMGDTYGAVLALQTVEDHAQ